ncbi:hypothetical protein PC128_g6984 [Phytophthora cactorum]|nr:hypothetical protein PC128_g6984 [Phytophthora cactorum]
MPKVGLGSGPVNWHFEIPADPIIHSEFPPLQYQRGTTDTGHTKACEATRCGLAQPGSRRRCATHKDVGGDANVNTNLGSNGVLANFQLAAGQLEVHASGECQRALQHLEKDVINEERQATPLISEPTPGVPIRGNV